MIECPKCLKITDYKRHCAHCGAIIIETDEDRFDNAAKSLELLLRGELLKRRKKRRIKNAVMVATVIFILIIAVYMGFNNVKKL
jgi:uncharacterized membrane protein YvbJ